jgi:hypothetical protein
VHTCRAYLCSRAGCSSAWRKQKEPRNCGALLVEAGSTDCRGCARRPCGRLRTPVRDLPRSFRGRPDAHHGPDHLGGYRWFGRGCVRHPCAQLQPRAHDLSRSCALRHAVPALASGSAARSGSFANFPPLASPPLLAMSRCSFSSVDAKPRFEVWNWSRSAIIIPRNCRVFITDSTLMTGDFIIKQSMIHMVPSILSKNWIGMKVTLLASRYRLAVRRTLLRQVRTQRHLDGNGLALFPHH